MLINVKMKVTPELEKLVKGIVCCNYPDASSFTDEEGTIYIAFTSDSSVRCEEVSAYDFIASQGQQAWLPKYGEEAEFSLYKTTWYVKTYSGYLPHQDDPFVTDCDCYYRYCRPLPKTKCIVFTSKNGAGYDIELTLEEIEQLKEQLCSVKK